MQIVHIENTKLVKKTKKEIEKELAQYKCSKEDALGFYINEYKSVPTNKPIYTVEMTKEELQLVSFYLELELL